MRLSRPCLILLLIVQLAACGVMKTTPVPPPAPTSQAQQVTRAQTSTLQKIGTISVNVIGSPMNVEDAIQQRAQFAGARYYLIIMMSETIIPSQWYGQAILYR
ncbi:biofilm peroxide resistance protein BsmA [Edaphovirga cremea]|uniref:biofilm peroxide resistance protein BsmA n=1 Tax=Edaphovirga cremea TaxID=2267246 RepID=UPI000DEED35D|nr:biofilm peroxide resistance protein BsmA [Edaphovirga cremea]